MSCVVPSLKDPIAANCCVLPEETTGFTGETTTDTRVPVPITSVAVPVTPKEVAEIVTVPAFLPCARPELRIDANCGLEDFQETVLRLAVLPSLKLPPAVKSADVCGATRPFAGLTVMEINLTVETVKRVD